MLVYYFRIFVRNESGVMIPLPVATAAIKSIKYNKVSTIEVLNSLSLSLFPSSMSENVKNLAVFYGTRCEVFDLNRAQSLEEFIEETFGIDKVFEEKLVVGWMLPEKEENITLSSRQDAEEFTTSRDSERARIVLIYDKPEIEDQPQSDFKVSRRQWEELVNAVRELQPSSEAKKSGSSASKAVHQGMRCEACYRKGKGVELKSHKNNHNIASIVTLLGSSYMSKFIELVKAILPYFAGLAIFLVNAAMLILFVAGTWDAIVYRFFFIDIRDSFIVLLNITFIKDFEDLIDKSDDINNSAIDMKTTT